MALRSLHLQVSRVSAATDLRDGVPFVAALSCSWEELVKQRNLPGLRMRLKMEGKLPADPEEWEIDSLLEIAASCGDIEVYKWLEENGAKERMRGTLFPDIRAIACLHGDVTLLKHINKSKWDIYDVATCGSIEEAEHLMKKENASLTALQDTDSTWRKSVLLRATLYHHLDFVEFILGELPDLVHKVPEFDRTPLNVAARHGNLKIIDLLLSRGAPLRKSKDNWSPLHYAALLGDPNTIFRLIQASCSVHEVTDENLYTPLLLTIHRSNDLSNSLYHDKISPFLVTCNVTPSIRIKAIELLLKADSSLTERDRDGNSCVLTAAMTGNFELLRFFLSKGCTLWDNNYKGESVLMLAVQSNNVELVEFILDTGQYKINHKCSGRYDCLYHAVLTQNFRMVSLLLEHGASAKLVYPSGATAFILAAQEENDEIVKLLLDYESPHVGSMDLVDYHSCEVVGQCSFLFFIVLAQQWEHLELLLKRSLVTIDEIETAFHLIIRHEYTHCMELDITFEEFVRQAKAKQVPKSAAF